MLSFYSIIDQCNIMQNLRQSDDCTVLQSELTFEANGWKFCLNNRYQKEFVIMLHARLIDFGLVRPQNRITTRSLCLYFNFSLLKIREKIPPIMVFLLVKKNISKTKITIICSISSYSSTLPLTIEIKIFRNNK